MPIELLTFAGHLNGNRVDLNWQTATEINNDYFIVERESDEQGVTEIGTVDGSGNTTQLRSYAFTDMSPNPGMNYYRLRQVDFNGSISYSGWVAVEFTPANNYVSIFPNPTEGTFNVLLSGYKDQTVTANVIDITGRILQEQQVTITSQEDQLSMDVSDQPAGIYFLTITTDQGRMVYRVVKY